MTRRHIYVVDDSKLVQRSLTISLQTVDNYAVSSFGTCAEFLRAIGSLRSGCVLLDILLPDCDGMDLLATLTRDYPRFATIVSSGKSGGDAILPRMLCAGAVDFLAKPFTVDRLAQAIDRGFERLTGGADVRRARSRLLALPDVGIDVLVDLASGMDVGAIAAANGLSDVVVANSIASTMRIFGVTDRVDLLCAAFAGGIGTLVLPVGAGVVQGPAPARVSAQIRDVSP